MKPTEYFVLKKDEVHIWTAPLLDSQNDIAYLTSLLSEDEHKRANSFRFSKDKNRYTIARGTLRCLLTKYLGGTPQNIEFAYGLWGKPYLSQKKTLYFNVSHSKDYALYAMTRDYEVGVDLEYIDKSLEPENIISSILSSVEQEFWKRFKSNNKTDMFFKLWTCKEAYLKAIGKGWLENNNEIPLEKLYSLEMQRNSSNKDRIIYPHHFECIPDYASALYIDGPPLSLVQFTWDPGLII